MIEKDPGSWNTFSILAALLSSLIGGLIAHVEYVKSIGRFSLLSFLFDVTSSCFIGFLAFWVAHDVMIYPESICACIAGFAGNLGKSVFDIAKRILMNKLGVKREE